jgi:hypothetical protein
MEKRHVLDLAKQSIRRYSPLGAMSPVYPPVAETRNIYVKLEDVYAVVSPPTIDLIEEHLMTRLEVEEE